MPKYYFVAPTNGVDRLIADVDRLRHELEEERRLVASLNADLDKRIAEDELMGIDTSQLQRLRRSRVAMLRVRESRLRELEQELEQSGRSHHQTEHFDSQDVEHSRRLTVQANIGRLIDEIEEQKRLVDRLRNEWVNENDMDRRNYLMRTIFGPNVIRLDDMERQLRHMIAEEQQTRRGFNPHVYGHVESYGTMTESERRAWEETMNRLYPCILLR